MRYGIAMQLSQETDRPRLRISGYDAHSLRLGEQVLTASSFVTTERILPWNARRSAPLDLTVFEPCFDLGVDVVLLASPDATCWPDPRAHAALAARGIGLEVMALGAAARTFNLLAADERPVVLAALLTP